jgi:hypothetical protein
MQHPSPTPEVPTKRPPAQRPSHEGRAAWWTFVILAGSLLPLFVMASFDFGATWDEKARHRYGEIILEYFRGLRSRSSFIQDEGGLYGGLFDTICAVVEQWVPANRYVLRHVINAIFGWIGVVYCGRLVARLFGRWPGILAMILLAASPRYFADSMNNPKDLPFAALTLVALYYFSTVSTTWPYISRGTAIKIVVVLALALNIRAGALLYLGYLGMLVAAFAFAERNLHWRRLAHTAGRLAVMTLGVLLLGTAFWPWAQGAPLVRPVEALLGMASYPWAGTVLFNGEGYAAPNLPWYYPLLWLVISTPPVVLVGVALSILVSRDRTWSLRTRALWAIAALPVLLVIIKNSTLYDGIRHLLFVYPILVAIAAAGWAASLSDRNRTWVRRTAAVVLAAGLFNVIAFDVRFHPNQGVYFNELVGGPRGAFAKFDMDYWGNCVLQGVAWSASAARSSGRVITISGNPWHLVQLDAERFHELSFVPPHRQHNVAVELLRGPAQGVRDLANRNDALHKVRTPDGAVLCVVVPGPAFAELQPHLAAPQGSRHLTR